MIRAAAKNFKHVLVVVDSGDYQRVVDYLTETQSSLRAERGNLSREVPMSLASLDDGLPKELAAKAFWHLSLYDSIIAKYLSKEQFPEELTIALRKDSKLRYGENPHQKAAFYKEKGKSTGLINLKQLQGKELSFNNILDLNSAVELVKELFAESVR